MYYTKWVSPSLFQSPFLVNNAEFQFNIVIQNVIII